MALRITLSEDEPEVSPLSIVPSAEPIEQRPDSVPAFADWDDDTMPALLLYLGDDPEIGKRFRYAGAAWEIVDYRDGWVARLLVD